MKTFSYYVISLFTLFSTSTFAVTESLPSDELNFSVIITAESSGSLEAMVVKGGSWLTKRQLVHTAVHIKHPKGDFLFDSGIGQAFEEQMSVFSFFEQQLFKIENVNPAKQQMAQAGYNFSNLKGIIPSHMHWDHASGLEDFIGTPVWIQKNSYEEALSGQPPGFVISQYDDENLVWNFFQLNDSSYEGFNTSLDLFNDGSVVLVDLSGHTRGQVGLFINLPNGERYFFIGDTTWSALGVRNNKPRPVFVDWLVGVDSDFEKNSEVIEKIHQLSVNKPDIVIVPAHDELVISQLPNFPTYLH